MGKKVCVLPKYVRQELILQILENFSKDEGLTTKEIMELLEEHSPVCSRTIYRDLEELSLRFPIFENQVDAKKYWKLLKTTQHKQELNLYRIKIMNELLELIEKKKTKISTAPSFID